MADSARTESQITARRAQVSVCEARLGRALLGALGMGDRGGGAMFGARRVILLVWVKTSLSGVGRLVRLFGRRRGCDLYISY